jgi:hypothetical protein
MIAADPSEAADSERILPSVREIFPDASIIETGGVIYHLALNDVFANFDESEDHALLQVALLLDRALTAMGDNHYAVAIATRGR